MVQIQQLIYFQKVAQLRSMNKAAEELYISQSNISKAMKSLEDQLQVILFKRSNKGVQLTEEGKKLLQYSKTILRQLELIDNISEKENIRFLSVSAYPVLTMSYFIKKYYENNKESHFEILVNEGRLETVLNNVIDLVSEVGLIQFNQLQENELLRKLKSSNLEFHKLYEDTWYANIGPLNPLYEKNLVTIDELLQYPIIRAKDDFFSSLSYYLDIDGHSLTEFKKTMFVNNAGTIVRLLQDTEGFRFGPGFSKMDYDKFKIRTIPIKNCGVNISVGWIKRKKEILSTEAQELIEIMTTYFKKLTN